MIPDDLLQLSFRWVHVLAAVLWLGSLFVHEWVLSRGLETLDGATRRGLYLELMPRALFWSRWAAAVTWLGGVSLALVLYYSGPYLTRDGTRPEAGQWLPVFGGLLLGYAVYDLLFRLVGRSAAGRGLGVLLWGAAVIGYGCWLDTLQVSNRARTVHVGALLATAMAGNVWLRIRPAQERILAAVARGAAPDPRDVAVAGERARHNVYMAFPVLLLMLAVDQPGLTGASPWQGTVAGVLAIGCAACWLVYAGARNVRGG